LREIALKTPKDENLERYKVSKIETNKTLRKEKRQEKREKLKKWKITDSTPRNSLAIIKISNRDINNKLGW